MGYQQAIIVGNVGRDVEVRQAGGASVAGFSVCVNETWKDRNTGERREKSVWFSVSCWGKLADVANQYVKKGSQIMVVGTVTARAFTDNNGDAKASLDLRADNFQLLGGRGDGNSDYGHDEQEAPSNNGGGGASLEDIPFDHEAYP